MKKKMILLILAIVLSCTSLSISFASDGGSFSKAESISLSDEVSGYLSEYNGQHVYKIVVPSGSSVQLNCDLTWYMYRVYLHLYNADGEELASEYCIWNSNISRGHEAFTYYLNPGTYYISMDRYYEDGNYTLDLSSKKLNNLDLTRQETLQDAKSITLQKDFTGVIAEGEYSDIYKIVVTQPGILKTRVKAYVDDVRFLLMDKEGNQLKSGYYSWNSDLGYSNELHKMALEKGTYYIQIQRANYWNTSGKYTINNVFTTIGSGESEKNNTLETADGITRSRTYKGLLGEGDGRDFYKVKLERKGNLKITLKSYMESIDFKLYDRNGNCIAEEYQGWNENVGYGKNTYTYSLSAGTYYLQMSESWRGYTGQYEFTASQPLAKGTVSSLRTPASGKMKVTWKKVTGADGYQIVYSRNKSFTNKGTVKVTSGKTLTKTLTKLRKGATYYVKVRAYEVVGGKTVYGPYSTRKSIEIAQPIAKAKITGIKKPAKRTMKVSWKKVTGADGYQIVYSRSKNFKNKGIVTVKSGKTLSKTIKNLKKGNRYYVKVRAYNNLNGKKIYGAYSNRTYTVIR